MSITVWVNTAAWEPADVVIHIQGMGTVLREKSLVAYEHESGKILAFGTEAERMFGMEEQGIRVVSPLRQGMVEDYAVAVQLFTCLLQKAVGKRSWRRPGIAVCVPRGITPVDKKAMEDALLQAGAKEVVLQEFPLKQFLMEEAEHFPDIYRKCRITVGVTKEEPERYITEALDGILQYAEQEGIPADRVMALLQKKC